MARKSPVSLQDVAKEAGVSPQTVSRVANGSDAVKPDTKQRVERAMNKLGYRPNYAARALKYQQFNNVGVILFDTSTFGNSRILSGISAAASQYDFAITMCTLLNQQERTLQAAMERMKQLPVDGVIVVLERRIPDFETFAPPSKLPVVLITDQPSAHCPTVDGDQYGCSTEIVDYLMRKGHKTVYHMAGPLDSRAAQSRERGWRDALHAHGITQLPPLYRGDWLADSGYQAGLALAHEPDCTAVYAANDQMAYGIMLGLRTAGKRVPEDVSIVGVDDSLVGNVPRLNLTTMRMRFDLIGREAFLSVKALIDGQKVETGREKLIASTFVERSSVRDLNAPHNTASAKGADTSAGIIASSATLPSGSAPDLALSVLQEVQAPPDVADNAGSADSADSTNSAGNAKKQVTQNARNARKVRKVRNNNNS
ncbi:MAG: LacI family DNA-binding transcriptional regulator [Alloscardovia omnicolens]|nr:LacI family DNA-binding transcriptional regulator [Alloscardovia omnicolens]